MSRSTPLRARVLGAAVVLVAGVAVALAPTADNATAVGSPAVGAVGSVAAADPPPNPDRVARAQRAQERLDRRAERVPREVASWYVDEVSGQTVVSVVGGRTPAVDAFTSDPDPAVVRVETGAEIPRPLAATPLVGGQAIYGPRTRCSLGFSVRQGIRVGVLTAGHCTEDVQRWSGANRAVLGATTRSAWPTDDYGLATVTNTRDWTPTGRVQGGATVTGARVAPIGATVCRSGSTTGYRCGKILYRNATVNYGGGDLVYGLTKTSACADQGDSGGPFVEPTTRQAQGLTSGGTGTCSSGGATFFQPVNEVLAKLRLTLVTG